MPRKNGNGFVAKLQAPKLNMEYYEQLWDILFLELLQANKASMSRLMGISIPTVGRYDPALGSGPPEKQYWWTNVLEHIIRSTCEAMLGSPKKRYRRRAKRVIQQMAENRHTRHMATQLIDTSDYDEACAKWLLALLAETKGQALPVQAIYRKANGIHKPRALRDAADRLCLVNDKRTEEWTWRLPDMEDCD